MWAEAELEQPETGGLDGVMRRILFQGKTFPYMFAAKEYPGHWIEGYYCSKGGLHFISQVLRYSSGKQYFSDAEVQPETVRQFTGFYDKNSRRIFDGDILKSAYPDEPGEVSVVYEEVFWKNGWYQAEDGDRERYDELSQGCLSEYSEVVGNIWDNAELLGGKK